MSEFSVGFDVINMFDRLSGDIQDYIIINYLSYEDFIVLCGISQLVNKRYYENNGNSIIWITFFQNNIGIKLPNYNNIYTIRHIFLELYHNLHNYNIKSRDELNNKLEDLSNMNAYKLMYKLYIEQEYTDNFVIEKILQKTLICAIIANDIDFFLFVSMVHYNKLGYNYNYINVLETAITYNNIDFLIIYIKTRLETNARIYKTYTKLGGNILYDALFHTIIHNNEQCFREIVELILSELNTTDKKDVLISIRKLYNDKLYVTNYLDPIISSL